MSLVRAMTPALTLALALLFITAHSTCLAHGDADHADSASSAAVEEIEEVELIEEVSARPETVGLLQTLGKFHPMMLHFPIAWLLLLVLVEIVALTGLAGRANDWSLALLVLTVVSFIPAIVSGLGLASLHAPASAESMERLLLHRNFNIAGGVVLLAALVVRLASGRVDNNRLGTVYLLLLFAAAGLMGYGSHLGGVMVWGQGFLPLPF